MCPVDLLAVTHEHRDHVSGFNQAHERETTRLGFEHVWFAWTERRRGTLSDELRAERAKERAALARVFRTAKSLASTPMGARQVRALEGVLAFHGPIQLPRAKRWAWLRRWRWRYAPIAFLPTFTIDQMGATLKNPKH